MVGWGAGHRDTDVGPVRLRRRMTVVVWPDPVPTHTDSRTPHLFSLTTVVRYTGSGANPL